MTIYEFLKLDLNERAEIVWKRGKHVDAFKTPEYTYSLYHLEDYYAEIVLNEIDAIIDVVPFKKGAALDKYLDRISIEDLKS